jgi:hypothetical protein
LKSTPPFVLLRRWKQRNVPRLRRFPLFGSFLRGRDGTFRLESSDHPDPPIDSDAEATGFKFKVQSSSSSRPPEAGPRQ